MKLIPRLILNLTGRELMIINGFRFGMLLQISIGPVCLYIFKTAAKSGILAAEAGVIAATIMDVIFVTLAIVGVGSLLNKPGVRKFLKCFGAAVLIYFGSGTILGSFGIHIIPTLVNESSLTEVSNAFVTSFILTASSPLSILFWTGVFATKLSVEGYSKREMKLFGVGAVLATFVFLGTFALIIGLLQPVMEENATIINILNIVVGVIIIGFGIKMAFSKIHPTSLPAAD